MIFIEHTTDFEFYSSTSKGAVQGYGYVFHAAGTYGPRILRLYEVVNFSVHDIALVDAGAFHFTMDTCSNGEVYNMHAMTAAHRTLPLGSIVRVTNLKTGHTALVRITDRGPFIPGRVLDLSLAAARKLDVYKPGVAEVRVDVMQTPAPIETGGKWAVQIGGFPDEGEATKLADHLKRRYRTAKVLRFNSPAGDWWVRVRVLDDDRERAQKLMAETETTQGAVFLVRLD